jgi:hypothetical protein
MQTLPFVLTSQKLFLDLAVYLCLLVQMVQNQHVLLQTIFQHRISSRLQTVTHTFKVLGLHSFHKGGFATCVSAIDFEGILSQNFDKIKLASLASKVHRSASIDVSSIQIGTSL